MKVLLLATAMTVAAGLSITAITAQQNDRLPGGVEVVEVQPGFHMIASAGSNVGVQIGEDGVVLVDAGSSAGADAVIAAVKSLTARPIRYIINTNADADHVGGNEKVSRAGQSLFLTGNLGPGGNAGTAINNNGAASIIGTENVLTRMSAPTG